MRSREIIATGLIFSSIISGQAAQNSSCLLDTAKNGDVVKFRGEAFAGGHNMFIRPTDCAVNQADRVVLVWADDRSLETRKASVRKDAAFVDFMRLLESTYPLPPGAVGTGQRRYQVVAEFEGRLEITDTVGLKRDPDGKATGVERFGSPMPFTRFRLVGGGVSHVEYKQLPRLPYR